MINNKNNKSSNNRGYILLLTLIIISLITVIITRVYYKSRAYVPFISTVYNREQSKLLALSGLELAKSQLSALFKKDKKSKDNLENFLIDIFPLLNTWQEVNLSKEIDGIDGKIQFCITSENGKLNINKLYNFEKNEFKYKDFSKILAKLNNKNFNLENIKDLDKFLSKKDLKLNSVSEILNDKKLAKVFKNKVFRKFNKSLDFNNLYLTDLFTTFSGSEKINPLLLSASMLNLLGINKLPNIEVRRSGAKKLLDKILNDPGETFLNKLLQILYQTDKNFKLSSGLKKIFKFELDKDQVFGISVCATTNLITERIFAIIKVNSNNGGDMSFDLLQLYLI